MYFYLTVFAIVAVLCVCVFSGRVNSLNQRLEGQCTMPFVDDLCPCFYRLFYVCAVVVQLPRTVSFPPVSFISYLRFLLF